MIIAGYTLGAATGYLLRGEYNYLIGVMDEALHEARARRFAGPKTFWAPFLDGHPRRTRCRGVHLRVEETSLLSSLEGYRGTSENEAAIPRYRRPYTQARRS